MNNKNPLVLLKDSAALKDIMIFLCWIASILIIAGIFWFSTQNLRDRLMIRAVNRVLEQSGDTRRLNQPSPGMRGSFLTGSWFTMIEMEGYVTVNRVIVFSFIGEGTFFPCAAVLSQDGKVEEFIPLNNHGEIMLKRISPGILRIYAKRIEGTKI